MTAIDSDINEIKRMFDVNVFGPMRMVRHFHSLLIAARGTIVNIGSVGGIVPFVYGCKLVVHYFAPPATNTRTYAKPHTSFI